MVHREGVTVHLQIRRRDLFAGPREGIECDVYVHVTDADALYAEYVGRNVRIRSPASSRTPDTGCGTSSSRTAKGIDSSSVPRLLAEASGVEHSDRLVVSVTNKPARCETS